MLPHFFSEKLVADGFWITITLHEEQMRLGPSLEQNQLSE